LALDRPPLPLFVYGSLSDPLHRAQIIGRTVEATPATLRDYKRGKSRYWFIRSQVGAITEGAILSDLTGAELAALDKYEEVPILYTRERVNVTLLRGEEQECWVYLPTGWQPGKTSGKYDRIISGR
jgi:gamma-glutamylcyclotransferase (GGCT)/AIG2-like uncharacterized protein YtfP